MCLAAEGGLEEGHQRVARELRALDPRSGSVQGDDVEHLLTDVDAEGGGLWIRSGARAFSPFCGGAPMLRRGAGRTIPFVVTLVAKRQAVAHLVDGLGMGNRWACRVIGRRWMTAWNCWLSLRMAAHVRAGSGSPEGVRMGRSGAATTGCRHA